MTDATISLNATVGDVIDFTDTDVVFNDSALSSDPLSASGGMVVGNVSGDGQIDFFDIIGIFPDTNPVSNGYLSTDLNLDGQVDFFDIIAVFPNTNPVRQQHIR